MALDRALSGGCNGAAFLSSFFMRIHEGRNAKTPFLYEVKSMRVLLKVKLPIEPFNAAVKDGSAGKKIKRILDEIKPEAVYFTAVDGRRGGILIVDLSDPSRIPSIAEPWFLQFHAECEVHPVMTPEDLAKGGLEELGKKWA